MPERGAHRGGHTEYSNPFDNEVAEKRGRTPIPERSLDDAVDLGRAETAAIRISKKEAEFESGETLAAAELSISLAKKREPSQLEAEPELAPTPKPHPIEFALLETPENVVGVDSKDGTFVFANTRSGSPVEAHFLASRVMDFLERQRQKAHVYVPKKNMEANDPNATVATSETAKQRVASRKGKEQQFADWQKEYEAHTPLSQRAAIISEHEGDPTDFSRVREEVIEMDLLGASQYARQLTVQFEHTRKIAQGTSSAAEVPAFLIGQVYDDEISIAEVYGSRAIGNITPLLDMDDEAFAHKKQSVESTKDLERMQGEYDAAKKNVRAIERRIYKLYDEKGWNLPRGQARKSGRLASGIPNLDWKTMMRGEAKTDEEQEAVDDFFRIREKMGNALKLRHAVDKTDEVQQVEVLRTMVKELHEAKKSGNGVLAQTYASLVQDYRWNNLDPALRPYFAKYLGERRLIPNGSTERIFQESRRAMQEPILTPQDTDGLESLLSEIKTNPSSVTTVRRNPVFKNLSRLGKFVLAQRLSTTFKEDIPNIDEVADELLRERHAVLLGRPGNEIGAYIVKEDGRVTTLHDQFNTLRLSEEAPIIADDDQQTKSKREIHEYELTRHFFELEPGDRLVMLPQDQEAAVFPTLQRMAKKATHSPNTDSNLLQKQKIGHLIIEAK